MPLGLEFITALSSYGYPVEAGGREQVALRAAVSACSAVPRAAGAHLRCGKCERDRPWERPGERSCPRPEPRFETSAFFSA